MNRIEIYAPRWKDRKVLIADWKVGMQNQIVITAKKRDGSLYYPEPAVMSGEAIRKYPLVQHNHGKMREVPLDDLWG